MWLQQDGQKLDVKDTENIWCLATVVEASITRVYIHYDEYHKKYDEWILLTSERIARFRSMTAHIVCPGCSQGGAKHCCATDGKRYCKRCCPGCSYSKHKNVVAVSNVSVEINNAHPSPRYGECTTVDVRTSIKSPHTAPFL